MSYKAYLFDFDYTLANAEAAIMRCYRAVIFRHGHPDVPDEVIKRGIGHGITEIFRRITGVEDKAVLEQYAGEYVTECDACMAANTFLYPSVLPVLTELKRRGAKTGIVSTKFRYRIMETIVKYDITNLIDVIIGGEDVSSIKPDPEGIRAAADRLGIGLDDILYTGDSTVDAQTAQNAGVDFAAVTTGATAADEFTPYPRVMIIDDLNALL